MKGNSGSGFGLSGLGMIGLLIVLGIVLLLAARAWQEMAPEAIDVTSASPQDIMETAGEDSTESPGHLPNLQEMRRNTSQHTQEVEEARRQLEAAEARPDRNRND